MKFDPSNFRRLISDDPDVDAIVLRKRLVLLGVDVNWSGHGQPVLSEVGTNFVNSVRSGHKFGSHVESVTNRNRPGLFTFHVLNRKSIGSNFIRSGHELNWTQTTCHVLSM